MNGPDAPRPTPEEARTAPGQHPPQQPAPRQLAPEQPAPEQPAPKQPAPRKHYGSALVILLLLAIITLNLILPLFALLRQAFDFQPALAGFVREFRSATTRRAVLNSLWVTSTASLIVVTLAFYFAYVVEFKLQGRLQKFFRFFAILPILMPSITYGIVIIYLFGKMGVFTRLLGFQLPIYGPLGIIMGSFFYAFPIAFLVLSQAFANFDARYKEAAESIGAKPFAQLRDILLPIMKYAVFSAFTVCFTMIFTDYGIPISVGGNFPILPLQFYKNVIGLLDFHRGAIYSILILLPAAAFYLLDLFYFSKKQVSSGHNIRQVPVSRMTPPQRLGFAAVTLVVLIPLLVVCIAPFIRGWPYSPVLTLDNFRLLIDSGKLGRLLSNSILVSLASGFFGTVLAFTAGYTYIRNKNANPTMKKLTHGLYMASLSVPGLALGLAFALFFRGSFVYNTFVILVMVNIVHFFGSPYLMAISHFKLLNPKLEDICRSMGGNWLHIVKDVLIPNSWQVLTDVFVYIFTNSMVTISAVSMLYTSKTMLLSLQLTTFNDQGAWENAIAVSLIIFVINAALKLWQSLRAAQGGRIRSGGRPGLQIRQ